MADFKYSPKKIEALFVDIYNGDVDPRNLPEDLYSAIADHLLGGVKKGFGGEIEFGTADIKLAEAINDNIYMFSAAKTFQQTLEMSGELVDEDGQIRPFKEFKKNANEIFNRYNGGKIDDVVKPGWLEAEYNTAIGQAQNAKKWSIVESQKTLFPYLRYNATNEACPICRVFNGVTLPVGHPFWVRYMPLNHFNCNCIVEQYEMKEGKEIETEEERVKYLILNNKVPDEFKFNPGKSGEVFSSEGASKHPYFVVPKEYKNFASENFGLPIYGTAEATLTNSQRAELNGLPRQPLYSKKDAELQERSLRQFVVEKKSLTKEYLKQNGNVVNTDEARKLFTGYNGDNASAVHEASSALSKEATKELVKVGKNDKVTLYAGGAGSGKTSAIDKMFPKIKEQNDLIIDGNLAKYEGALQKIGSFVKMGKKVDINYVYRDPLDAWENGVIKRMLENKAEMGRIVPLSTFLDNTTGSLDTVQKLVRQNMIDKIRGLKINIIDNSLGKGKTEMMNPVKFGTIKYDTNLKQIIEDRTKMIYESGRITKRQYEELLK